jgi:glycosyltransferase involved in cell wall biosynthesis
LNSDTPILVIGYNREEKLRSCIQYLRDAAKSRKIYIAIDGPKENEEDIRKVALCREIVRGKSHESQVDYYLADTNRGCRNFVLEAISWVANKEKFFIVVEDDVFISRGFIDACDDVNRSERFRDHSVICGCVYENRLSRAEKSEDWMYTYIVNVWGWAVSAEVWQKFREWERSEKLSWHIALKTVRRVGLMKTIHLLTCLVYSRRGMIDTWDYDLGVFLVIKGIRCFYPTRSLTTNFGFGVDATHTKSEGPEGLVVSEQIVNSWDGYSLLGICKFAKQYQDQMTFNIPFKKEFFLQGLKALLWLTTAFFLRVVRQK